MLRFWFLTCSSKKNNILSLPQNNLGKTEILQGFPEKRKLLKNLVFQVICTSVYNYLGLAITI